MQIERALISDEGVLVGTLKKRLLKLEERFEIDDTDIFCNHVKIFYIKYGAPTPNEFEVAERNRHRLESVDWLKQLLAKGGKEEFLGILYMAEVLEKKERQKLM